MSGVLEGGWEFVRAAYLLTAVVFVGYAVSVHRRYRAEKSRAGTSGRGRPPEVIP
jgi:Holliday junction resolvasome RuvABC DNA-binding subunit